MTIYHSGPLQTASGYFHTFLRGGIKVNTLRSSTVEKSPFMQWTVLKTRSPKWRPADLNGGDKDEKPKMGSVLGI